MTGPEHYRRAEELIAEANAIIMARLRNKQRPGPPDLRGLDKDTALRVAADAMLGRELWISDPGRPERNMAEAQVHATLALAAAAALGAADADSRAWADVAGT